MEEQSQTVVLIRRLGDVIYVCDPAEEKSYNLVRVCVTQKTAASTLAAVSPELFICSVNVRFV